jgi:NAD(P)-dependent dehydrogenase (short-subunit alcohol dehydrogenase family)
MQVRRRDFLKMSAKGVALAMPFVAGCGNRDTEPAAGVTRSPFDEDSTAEEVTEGIDLDGKIAVVTGCNSGIGYETMRVLALRGAYVIGTGRTLEKAQLACASVLGVTSPMALELSDFNSVVACANKIRNLRAPIDILVCNAGMRGGDHQLTAGVERHLAVNHLGHSILVNRLLDRLYFANQGRVVVVASQAAYTSAPEGGIQFDDLAGEHDYSVGRAYAHSKLANVLYSLQLAKLLKGSRITSNSLHPGVIATNIVRDENALVRTGFRLLTKMGGKTVAEGAATSCFVATSPALRSTSGQYFEDCNAVTVKAPGHMHDAMQAERLWQVSEELTRDYIVALGTPDPKELLDRYRRPAA